MQRTKVESSNISAVGYDLTRGVLEIEFTSGSVYQYIGVSLPVYREFMRRKSSGESIGKYFHSNVRNVYPYTRVS